jgi:hypothetical protein
VAVFSNCGANPLPSILINYICDRVCGNEPVPWLDRSRDLRLKALAQEEIDETSAWHSASSAAAPHKHARWQGGSTAGPSRSQTWP